MRKEKKLEMVNQIIDTARCMREEIKEEHIISSYIDTLKYYLQVLENME